jgi:thioredoxin 1
MPILDTPITTDDNNLKNVLGQNIPVALYLYDSQKGVDKPLDDTLKKAAKKQAGELLVVKVDVASNPNTRRDYGELDVPALVTSTKAMLGRKVKSQVSRVRPADVRAHIDYLLERGPEPVAQSAQSSNGASSPNKKATSGPMHVTDGNFNQVVLKSKQPVLVDFWAPWCAPCRAIAPVIEEMAQTYAGRVRVVKVNTDENPGISRRFQIQAIPTLMMFKNGQPVERRSGGNRNLIRSMIEDSLL